MCPSLSSEALTAKSCSFKEQPLMTRLTRIVGRFPLKNCPILWLVSQNAQIRVDHGDRVEDIKGVINILHLPQTSADGRIVVPFEGEVSGDEELLAKIEREYVNSVSPRILGRSLLQLMWIPLQRRPNEFGAYLPWRLGNHAQTTPCRVKHCFYRRI